MISSSLTPSPGACAAATTPCPVTTARNAVALYLYNAGLTDASCLNSAPVKSTYVYGSSTSGPPTWTWTCSGITLTINHLGAAMGGVVFTTVSLTYPVKWSLVNFMSNVYQQFQGVTVQPVQISTTVTMPNLTN